MRGRGSSEEWRSAKPRGSERWKKRTHGLSVWWPTRPCRFTSSRRSTQKSGEPVCKTTGCEDECARRSGQIGSGVQGAGTVEIELLSQRAIEPGEPAHPQGSARAKRAASSLRISAHYRADAAGRLRGQWETSGADSERGRNQGEQEATPHEAFRDLDGRAAAC